MSAAANPLPPRILNLPHHRSRLAVVVLDRLFHFIGWLWSGVILGGLVVNVLLSLAQYGSSGLGDPSKWVLAATILAHLPASIGIGAVLLLLTVLGWLAHLSPLAHPKPTDDGFATVPVKSARLTEFKLGADPSEVYFERAAFTQAREAIRRVVKGAANGRIGFVVFGLPMVGKTRLAVQALRREAPEYPLLVWPHGDVTLSEAVLARFKGKPLALLLDDLQEFARQNEANRVLDAVTKLQGVCAPLLVVATSRPGSDQDAVERDFIGLLEKLERVTLEPMEKASDEANRFLATMKAAGAELHTQSFDGTPGSALLDLDRRTAQLREPAFPRDALAIMKALALLRRARVYRYPEERARRVAVGIFGMAATSAAWDDARERLVRDGWLRLGRADAGGESTLRLPSDAYLDQCVAALYPLPGRRVEDDFPALQRALSDSPADADALFALADALGEDPLGNKAEQGELALAGVTAGLAAIDVTRDAELWASGQVTLGSAYLYRIRGERAENLEAAIAAYEAALTVYTRAAFPSDWALTQNNLGEAYRNRIRGERAENLERAIAAYTDALTVYTRAAFPADWAGTQNNLGIAYRNRIRGERAENLEAAIAAYEAALTVRTRAAFPSDWAMTQNNLGAAYRNRIRGERAENLERAIQAYTDALTVYTRAAFPPNWAMSTHNVALLRADLADAARMRKDTDECRTQRAAGLEAMRSTLAVFTADGFPDYHAMAMRQVARIEAMTCEPDAPASGDGGGV